MELENQWLKRDEMYFAVWSARRLNLERAMQEDDTLMLDEFMELESKARWLDTMLARMPKRMEMWGLEDHALGSLRLLEGLVWEIKTGVEVPLDEDLSLITGGNNGERAAR